MEILVSTEQARVPVTVFQIKGEIAQESYRELEQQARDAYEAGMRDLLLDLTKVTFVSSAGLRAFHTLFELLRSEAPEESEGEMLAGITAGTFESPHLKLLNPSKKVLEILKLTGYDMFLPIYSNRKKALASF